MLRTKHYPLTVINRLIKKQMPTVVDIDVIPRTGRPRKNTCET